MRTLFVTLLLTAAAWAQDCPTKITFVGVYPDNPQFSIQYTNLTDKVIKAVRFDATFYDAVADPVAVFGAFVDDSKVKPGKGKWGIWTMTITYNRSQLAGGEDVWPTKVVFEDGTVWENNEVPRRCITHRK
jgi:hypothetical protein